MGTQWGEGKPHRRPQGGGWLLASRKGGRGRQWVQQEEGTEGHS